MGCGVWGHPLRGSEMVLRPVLRPLLTRTGFPSSRNRISDFLLEKIKNPTLRTSKTPNPVPARRKSCVRKERSYVHRNSFEQEQDFRNSGVWSTNSVEILFLFAFLLGPSRKNGPKSCSCSSRNWKTEILFVLERIPVYIRTGLNQLNCCHMKKQLIFAIIEQITCWVT